MPIFLGLAYTSFELFSILGIYLKVVNNPLAKISYQLFVVWTKLAQKS